MGGSRAARALAALAAVAPPIVAIFCVEILPTLDGPKNLYAAHVRFHLDEPRLGAEFKGLYPVSAFGFAAIYGALERLVGWRMAYQLSFAVCAVGMCAAFFALARALDPRRWPLGVLGFGVAMQWAVYMGFVNYVASLGVGLGALAVGLATPVAMGNPGGVPRTPPAWTWRREVAIALLLLLACAFHPMGAQLAGAGLFLARALDTPRGLRVRRLGVLCLMGAGPLFVTLASGADLDDFVAKSSAVLKPVSLPAGESLANFALCFLPGPAWRAWPLSAAAAIGLAIAAAETVRRRRKAAEAALLVIGVASVAAAMLTPFHGVVWQYLSPRFIPIAVLLGVVLLPIERLGRRASWAVIAVAYGFDVLSNGWAASYNVRFWERWHEALAGLGAPSRKGNMLLPIIAVPEIDAERGSTIPYASALRNLGELYGVDRAAVAPYAFAFLPSIHLLRQRGNLLPRVLPAKKEYGAFFAPGVDPEARRREVVRLASFGDDYDEVLFLGSAGDADVLVGLGYAPEVRDGGFMIARFVGCGAELHAEGGEAPFTVSVGWLPSTRAAWRARVVKVGVVPFPPVSCEGIWVRVIGDDGARCAGADAEGSLHVATRRDAGTVVDCHLAPGR